MKIVHLINELSANGGAERLLIELARCSKTDETFVITWRSQDNALLDEIDSTQLTAISLKPLSIRALISAWKHIQTADMCHVHLFPSLYLGAVLPARKIFTEHNSWNRRRQYPILKFLEKLAYRRYDHIVAISEEVKIALEAWLPGKTPKISIIENGIDIDRFSHLPRGLPTHKKRYIGMVSSFSKQKDQDTLVRALKHLPEHFEVSFAGKGPRLTHVKQLAEDLGLSERVRFHGLVRDIPEFLRNIDIYVQSSHWEGFGIAAVEAMSSALPTVVSNVPGLVDVVGDAGLIFQTKDDTALSRILLNLGSDATAYKDKSKKSVLVAKQYSIETTYKKYRELYRE